MLGPALCAEGYYPPTAAAQIADRIRAIDSGAAVAPPVEPVGAASSTAAAASAPAAPQAPAAPAAAAPKAKPALGLPLPGVTSRQEGGLALPPAAAGLSLLPGINRRQDAQNGIVPPTSTKYVTATPTTPLAASKPRPKPVPIASLASSADGAADARMQNVRGRWRSISGHWRSGVSGISGETPASINSLNSSSFQDGGASLQVPRTGLPLDSATSWNSFKWAPEALVRSWHRKLSETYRDYDMVDVIGEGVTGAVFAVQHKRSEKYYACKMLLKNDIDAKSMRAEIEMLRRLDHPNVVRLYETNEDHDAVFLLMELCRGGDLLGRIIEKETLCEREARVFTQQTLSALAYCHKMGIVHRDIKPENLLLESRDPDCLLLKLCDFGIATRIRRPRASTNGSELCFDEMDPAEAGQVHGSRPCMAPEFFRHTWGSLAENAAASGSPRRHSEALAAGDLWSCGIVIYVMLSGAYPFGEDVDMICSGQPPDVTGDEWRTVSGSAIDLMNKLIQPSIEKRWTAKQALEHEWFRGHSFAPPSRGGDARRRRNEVDRGDLARDLVLRLRRWKGMNKLRRMCIAAIAKRLEADNAAAQFARTVLRTFATRELLHCDELTDGLVEAINEATSTTAAATATPTEAVSRDQESAAQGTTLSSGFSGKSPACASTSPGASASLHGSTMTGLHMRQRMRIMVRKITRISEDTPVSTSSPFSISPGADEFSMHLTELKALVASLDGMKNGIVDYTLLVAAVMSDDTFSDEQRLHEAFDSFDLQKRGSISPDCLKKAFRSKDASAKKFAELMAPFDLNGDGVLDIEEFRLMIRGVGEAGAPDHSEKEAPVAFGAGCGLGFPRSSPVASVGYRQGTQ